VETVVEVIKKAGKQLRKGKQANVHELSSIASSPLPDAQPRAPFSYVPSPIRNPFATPIRQTRITALMEAPPPPSKTGTTSRKPKLVPGQESHKERDLNDEQTKKKIAELVSQNEGLELNIVSLKEEIVSKQVKIRELENKKAILQSRLLGNSLFSGILDQHTMVTFAEELRDRLDPPSGNDSTTVELWENFRPARQPFHRHNLQTKIRRLHICVSCVVEHHAGR
jgi:hypothetical protein